MASHSWIYRPMLRRTYKTSTNKPQPQYAQINTYRYKVPAISTLRPKKLVYSDFLVLAGKSRPYFRTQLSLHAPEPTGDGKRSRPIRLNYGVYSVKKKVELKGDDAAAAARVVANEGEIRSVVHAPFPEHSRGFLYLHQPPPDSGLPRSARAIRFRCVPSLVDVSSSYVASMKAAKDRPSPLAYLPSSIKRKEICKAFKSGYDLTLSSGIPWSIPIVAAASRPSLEFIRLQLLEDKLLRESELKKYEDIYKSTSGYRRRIWLHSLSDVFPIKFDKSEFDVWTTVAKGGRKEKANQAKSRLKGVFMDFRSEHDEKFPYTGAALARFELVPGSNPSKPAVSLRIVKITKPAECVIPGYDGYINMPKESELVARGLPGKQEPWKCHLDPSIHTHQAILSLVPGYVANANLC